MKKQNNAKQTVNIKYQYKKIKERVGALEEK